MAWGKRSWDAFYRQELRGYKHIISIRAATILFAVMGVLMAIVGAIFLWTSQRQVSVHHRYGDEAGATVGDNITLSLHIHEDMTAPIRIYYRLEDYYQNHKRYARSLSWQQIHGDNSASLSSCEPQETVNVANGADPNGTITGDGTINPCGLAAWSFFNDTFTDFTVQTGTDGDPASLIVDSSELVWSTDRDGLFGNYTPVNFNTFAGDRGGGQIAGNVSGDEHFMAWMRFSAKPDVEKFWGKVDRDLKKGEQVNVVIGNLYNTYGFKGKKSLILTTSSSFGRGNITFAVVWLLAAAVWLLATVFYLSKGYSSGHFEKRTDEERTAWLQSRLSWAPKR